LPGRLLAAYELSYLLLLRFMRLIYWYKFVLHNYLAYCLKPRWRGYYLL